MASLGLISDWILLFTVATVGQTLLLTGAAFMAARTMSWNRTFGPDNRKRPPTPPPSSPLPNLSFNTHELLQGISYSSWHSLPLSLYVCVLVCLTLPLYYPESIRISFFCVSLPHWHLSQYLSCMSTYLILILGIYHNIFLSVSYTSLSNAVLHFAIIFLCLPFS